jgi:hypothetical protein
MDINIFEIQDSLDGYWWHHISAENFGFMTKIPDLKNHQVNEGDILIHKEMQDEERFPTMRYHTVKNKVFKTVENKIAKEILANNFVKFIKSNKKIPYACNVSKFYKNGSAKVDYKPSHHDSFALRILPKIHQIPDIQDFFSDLESIMVNPIHGEESDNSSSLPKKTWNIASSSNPSKSYTVILSNGRYTCTCPQFKYRRQQCKHIDECL